MKIKILTTALCVLSVAVPLSVSAQSATAKPSNCAIYAEMSAKTVEVDPRFDGHDDIPKSLMKFADAQWQKKEAGMAGTYEASKAFGWNKEKVDQLIEESEEAVRAGFFTSTMDESKLYMDHVQAVYACGQAQTKPEELGQSPEDLLKVLQKMGDIARS